MIGSRSRIWTRPPRVRWILIVAFAANAPDLDFLYGLATGNINRYHPNPSHSILAALVFAVIAAMLLGRTWAIRYRLTGLMVLLYGSHIVLDMFSESSPTRPGLQLFWPLFNEGFLSPWRPLRGILHGGSGGDLFLTVRELLSWHNLGAVALEAVVFLPLLWLSLGCGAWPRGAPRR